MAYLTTGLLQTYLEGTKLTVQAVDTSLEAMAVGLTFGRLSARFDITVWTNTASTPALVLQLCAVKYCEIFYRRQYSESLEEDNNYAVFLGKLWDSTLDLIVTGEMDIGIVVADTGLFNPIFYPNDASTSLADTDPTNVNASPRMFTVGKAF